jgi:hypothetical protein
VKTVEEKKAEQREKRISEYMDKCAHFNGVQNDTCKAGVNYESAFPTGGIPCFRVSESPGRCSLVQLPTREQATQRYEEREAQIEKSLNAMRAAHADAAEKGFGKRNGGVSQCPCPACGTGTIRYSVASLNGHMHARCTTQGCVSWME